MPRKYQRARKVGGNTIIRLSKRYKKRSRRLRRYALTSNPHPLSRVVKLRYAQQITITHGALGIPGVYTFRANSLFDPDYTGVGHQPLFRDQFSALYNHYVVLGAKITARFAPNTDTNAVGAIVGIKLDDNHDIPITIFNIIENGSSTTRYKMLSMSNQVGKGFATVTKFFSAKKFFGVKDVKDNKQDLGAYVGNNPTDDAYFNLFFGSLDGETVLEDLPVAVTIEYIVHYSEPSDHASS